MDERFRCWCRFCGPDGEILSRKLFESHARTSELEEALKSIHLNTDSAHADDVDCSDDPLARIKVVGRKLVSDVYSALETVSHHRSTLSSLDAVSFDILSLELQYQSPQAGSPPTLRLPRDSPSNHLYFEHLGRLNHLQAAVQVLRNPNPLVQTRIDDLASDIKAAIVRHEALELSAIELHNARERCRNSSGAAATETGT